MKTSLKLAAAILIAIAIENAAFNPETWLCAIFTALVSAAIAVKLGECGIRPLRRALERIKAMPPLAGALFSLLALAAIVYGSVKGNSPMSQPGPPGGLSPVSSRPIRWDGSLAPMRSGSGGFTEGQLAAGFVLQMIESGGNHQFEPPPGASICGKWVQRGAYEDAFAITNVEEVWYFPFGTSTVERLDVWAGGYALPHLKGSASGAAGDGIIAPFKDALSVAPWFNWMDTNSPSRVWHAARDDGGLVVGWQNALAFRDIERPVSVRLELDPSGDFTYRYSFSPGALAGAVSMPYIGAANSGEGEGLDANSAGITPELFAAAATSNTVSLIWKRLESGDAENPDRDGDGLSTAGEIFMCRTDPSLFDSDGDGLGDGDEIALGTDPLCRDSDGDGLCDGSDPSPLAVAAFTDLDGDGLDDAYETHWFGSTNEVSLSHVRDGTGFTPLFKMASGMNPTNGPTSCATMVEDSLLSWKLFDGFDVTIPTNGSDVVYERTFPIYRSSSWQQFFISSKPDSAGAWRLEGMTLEWEDSEGTEGSAARSPFGDSLRLQLSQDDPTNLTVRLRASSPSIRSKGPLYLIEYAPDVSLTGGDNHVTLGDGSEVTVFTNGVIEALHVGIDRSMRPSTSPLSDEELLMEGVLDIGTVTGGAFRFEGGPSGGDIMANSTGIYYMPTLYVEAPALGASAPPPRSLAAVGAPQMLVVLRPSVWYGEDCHAATLHYDWTSGGYGREKAYPLDSSCLRRAWRRDSTGMGVCDCEPGVSSGLLSPPDWIGETVTVSNNVATGVVTVGGTAVWTGTARHTLSGHDAPLWESIESTSECGECENSCEEIDFSYLEGAELGSFKFRIPLGAARRGQVAGFVYADLDEIQQITLETFQSMLREDAGCSDVETAGTRTVKSLLGGTQVKMTAIADGVRLSVEDIAGNPRHAWEITNVAGGGIRARKMEPSGGVLEDSTFTLDAGAWSKADTLRGVVETLQRDDHLDEGGVLRETRTVLIGGLTASGSVKEYTLVGNLANAVLRETRSVESNGAGDIVTTATYWCDEANPKRHGKLKTMVGDSIGWQYHEWNAYGDETMRVECLEASRVPDAMPSLLGGEPANLADVDLAEATVYGYAAHQGDGCNQEDASKPRTVTRYVIEGGEAKLTARSWHRYTRGTCMGYGTIIKETWRACSADATRDDPGNAYSREEVFDSNGAGTPIVLRGRTVESLDEDGVLESHTFTVGVLTVTDESIRSFESVPMPTYEVTELDAVSGLPLREATCMVEDDTPVEEEIRTYDSRGRILTVSYLDGTAETNVYSGDLLVWRRDRQGRIKARSGGGSGDRLHYAEEELWLAGISTNGFKVTHHFLDGLGRETNSFVAVGVNPGCGASPVPPPGGWKSSVSTRYPQGGDAVSIFTDERGLATECRLSAHGGVREEETIEGAGAVADLWTRTLVSRRANGGTVERKEWSGMWREDFKETSYDALGRKVVIGITFASGMDPMTNSVAKCDFLGRVVEETRGQCTISNSYYGAGSRISSVSRNYGGRIVKDEVRLYDSCGRAAGSLSGGVTSMRTEDYEKISNAWWLVTRETRSAPGMTNLVSELRERRTGFAPQVRSEMVSYSPKGGWTTAVETETATGTVERTVSSGAMADRTETLVCGLPVSVESGGQVRMFEYDALGRVTRESLQRPGQAPARLQERTYSQTGDLSLLKTYTNETFWAGTWFTYDARGRAITCTDAMGRVKRMGYDANGRRTLLGGAQMPERRSYDALGRLKSVSTTRNGSAWDSTAISYDPETGFELARLYKDGSSRTIAYSPDSLPVSVTHPSGKVTAISYDGNRRISHIVSDGVEVAAFAYDALGAISLASNGVVSVESLNSPDGFATNETVTAACGTVPIVRAKDGCGRLVAREIGGWGLESVAYGADGAISSISNDAFLVTYLYSGDGYDIGRTTVLSNGVTFTETKTRGGDFTRDRVLAVENGVAGGVSSTVSYSYDALGRTVARGGVEFGRDARGEISSEVRGGATEQHSYDYAGNRTSTLPAGGGAQDVVRYTANALNQYTGVGGESVSYYADGGLASFGDMAFSYDGEGRLSSVSTNGVSAFSISYDAIGRMARLEYADKVHTFVHDGNLLVMERIDRQGGAADEIRCFWGKDVSGTLDGAAGVGGLVCVAVNGEWFVPEFDAQGNVLRYRDMSGAVAAGFTYDAFGNVLSTEGTGADNFRFRFSTRYREGVSGLYLYMYRAYSPVLGRFITRDPLDEDGGANLYAFCGNDPVDGYDALGLFCFQTFLDRNAWTTVSQFFLQYKLYLSSYLLNHSLQDSPSSPVCFGHRSLAARLVQSSPEYMRWLGKELKNIYAAKDTGSDGYRPADGIVFSSHGLNIAAWDLCLALHEVKMSWKYKACIASYGRLKLLDVHVRVDDKYDFDYHTLERARKNDEWFAVTIGNNLAYLSQCLGAIVPYDVIIEFRAHPLAFAPQ